MILFSLCVTILVVNVDAYSTNPFLNQVSPPSRTIYSFSTINELATKSRPTYISGVSSFRSSSLSALDLADINAPVEDKFEEDDEDDEEEWEYEEFENLEEKDFYDSEWKVGTLIDGKKKISETWCRLIVQDGKNVMVWGDKAQGLWNFDASSQFLSMSKDSWGGWFGKKLWAGTVDDFYFIEGTVRGWSPISAASVRGQWQAKRLGVSKDESGIAPWFEEEDEDIPSAVNKEVIE